MTEDNVVELMKQSKTQEEWNTNCNTVKAAFNGQYPDFWETAVVAADLENKTKKKNGWEKIEIKFDMK